MQWQNNIEVHELRHAACRRLLRGTTARQRAAGRWCLAPAAGSARFCLLQIDVEVCCQIGRVPAQLGYFRFHLAGKKCIGRVYTFWAAFANIWRFFNNVKTAHQTVILWFKNSTNTKLSRPIIQYTSRRDVTSTNRCAPTQKSEAKARSLSTLLAK